MCTMFSKITIILLLCLSEVKTRFFDYANKRYFFPVDNVNNKRSSSSNNVTLLQSGSTSRLVKSPQCDSAAKESCVVSVMEKMKNMIACTANESTLRGSRRFKSMEILKPKCRLPSAINVIISIIIGTILTILGEQLEPEETSTLADLM